ncbi:hypothetical protein Q3G72_023299 [Acer saccharum]|nr:hypothetical protein Q3G72_023299 [Acer saccharum]
MITDDMELIVIWKQFQMIKEVDQVLAFYYHLKICSASLKLPETLGPEAFSDPTDNSQALAPLLDVEEKISTVEAEKSGSSYRTCCIKSRGGKLGDRGHQRKKPSIKPTGAIADSQSELALSLKKAKTLEAEIPAKIAQAVEASNKFRDLKHGMFACLGLVKPRPVWNSGLSLSLTL